MPFKDPEKRRDYERRRYVPRERNQAAVNEKIRQSLLLRGASKKRVCQQCGVAYDYKTSASRNFCQLHKRDKSSFDSLQRRPSFKRRLLRERGHRCEICCNVEWMGKPIPLQIDHIDGNKHNNQKVNLRLLCANCHAQTDTFAGKNAGRYSRLV